eukprot:4570650-Amphidinium_carterae.1
MDPHISFGAFVLGEDYRGLQAYELVNDVFPNTAGHGSDFGVMLLWDPDLSKRYGLQLLTWTHLEKYDATWFELRRSARGQSMRAT